MASVYLALFVIGLALTMISFLTGTAGHGVFHLGHFGHFGGFGHTGVGHGGPGHGGFGHGGAGHGGSGDAAGDQGLSVVNFATAAIFMTWFGGVGYLLSIYSHLVVLAVIGTAITGGLAGAALIFVFMARLAAADRPLEASDYSLPGTVGRITVPVPLAGTGEITYTQAGTRKTAAARSDDGEAIVRGTEVVVLRYDRGIAYVRPWDQVASELGGNSSGEPSQSGRRRGGA